MEQKINIFISSAFRNMHLYRDQLLYEVRPMVNHMLQKKGLKVHLNFIDLRWGVDERQTDNRQGMYSQILETCFQSLDKTDIFVGMYTDYRGTFVPDKEIDLLNEQYHWNLPHDNSLTELEFWYCKNVKKTPTEYYQIYFQEQNALHEEIIENGNSITIKGNTTEKLDEKLAENICIAIEEKLNNSSAKMAGEYENSMIFRSEIINEIIYDLFFDDSEDDSRGESVKLAVLTGESGIGKSVLLSQLNSEIIRQKLLTPVYLADASHISALDDLLDAAFDAYDVEAPNEEMTLAEKIRFLRKKLSPFRIDVDVPIEQMTLEEKLHFLSENISYFRIPCFIIDSLDDISPEYFNQFLMELNDNFRECYVITSTTRKIEKEIQGYIYRTFDIKAFGKPELEAAVDLHEKIMLKQFPVNIRKELIALENTVYAKPIIFQLILNDLSLLSAKDYTTILNSTCYGLEIEKIMINRLRNYSSDIQEIISEICSRIAGKADNDGENELIHRYLALIILSYQGVNEEYLSNVMGEQWKPLLFYQLKYSFRNIFAERDNCITFSHQIFRSAFGRIISSETMKSMANSVISKRNVLDDDMDFEKYRMCFWTEQFDKWYDLAQSKEGWNYLSACLNEYCQLEYPLGKDYLSVPIHWIEYMAELSEKHVLNTHDYLALTGSLYEFVNKLMDTTSAEVFDTVLICCQHYIDSFRVFAENCEDEEVVKQCTTIIRYFYQRVIECAETFSLHEEIRGFVEAYETITKIHAAQTEANDNAKERKQKIEREMWQLFHLARFKLEMDLDREEVKNDYLEILKLSQREKIIFPNFGQIVSSLLTILKDITPVVEYIEFGIRYIDELMLLNEKFSSTEIISFINMYHCKIMIEGYQNRIEEKGNELIGYALKEYKYARLLYEKMPEEVQFVYIYSMACSDLTLIYSIFKDYDKIKELNETNRKLKRYLRTKYPDTFLYAESYSVFLHNCANYEEIYSEDERVHFIDESFETLSPYLKLNNVKASWTYLNHWKMIVDVVNNQKHSEEYKTHILKTLERHLQYLPQVLQLIFESDEHNIDFRKEAMSRVGEIYNLYRFVADKKILRVLANEIYNIAIQICDIENSDSSYLFLESTIKTLCADQASDLQDGIMDDTQLLHDYQKYIESKLKTEPQRIVFHRGLLAVPETEMIQTIGMLSNIEKMPEMAKIFFVSALEKLDIYPAKIILDSARNIVERMEIMHSLGGDIPENTIRITGMILSQVLKTEKNYEKEIVEVIGELEKFEREM